MELFSHPWVWLAGLSFLTFVASLGIAFAFVLYMPTDYLTPQSGSPEHRTKTTKLARPRWASLILVVLRNFIGLLCLVAGIIMLVTPGQGLLFILIGLALSDLPGKKRLMSLVLARPKVINSLNRIRVRHGKQPLLDPEVPNDSSSTESSDTIEP